ncbi:hypothetical protein H4219_001953 [Mycoemilia scoparia]|uniref:Uncharacterized protein n=1 Tax=Mycoemilia scoparia TaxID=417184 RepID=A0A9W8A6X7_9FUNG|nr:hypothetical protein H4219_001953 [Mycoemilia scoparia]
MPESNASPRTGIKRMRSFWKKLRLFKKTPESANDSSENSERETEESQAKESTNNTKNVEHGNSNNNNNSKPLNRNHTTRDKISRKHHVYTHTNMSTPAIGSELHRNTSRPTKPQLQNLCSDQPIPKLKQIPSTTSTAVDFESSPDGRDCDSKSIDTVDKNKRRSQNGKHHKRVSLLQPSSYYRQVLISGSRDLGDLGEDSNETSSDETVWSKSTSSSPKSITQMTCSRSEKSHAKGHQHIFDSKFAPISVSPAPNPHTSPTKRRHASQQYSVLFNADPSLCLHLQRAATETSTGAKDRRKSMQAHLTQLSGQALTRSSSSTPFVNHPHQTQEQIKQFRRASHHQYPAFITKTQHPQLPLAYPYQPPQKALANGYSNRNSIYGYSAAAKSETSLERKRASLMPHPGMIIAQRAARYSQTHQQPHRHFSNKQHAQQSYMRTFHSSSGHYNLQPAL